MFINWLRGLFSKPTELIIIDHLKDEIEYLRKQCYIKDEKLDALIKLYHEATKKPEPVVRQVAGPQVFEQINRQQAKPWAVRRGELEKISRERAERSERDSALDTTIQNFEKSSGLDFSQIQRKETQDAIRQSIAEGSSEGEEDEGIKEASV